MSDHANPTETKPRRKRGWLVPTGIIVIAGLLLANVVLQLRPDQPAAAPANESAESSAAPAEAPDLTVYEYRDANDVHAAGPVDAPVGLIVFSDYQCQYCAKWTTQTLPVMLEFAEAGDLRIEWRDINMYGEASDRAARAAHAAGLQSTFWEFHTALYPDGNHRTEAELSREALVATAAELGLDTEQFVADMNSPAVARLLRFHGGYKLQLLVHGGVFYLGLALTLVPFGLGLGALGSFFISERGLIIAITAVVLVVLGVAQIFGFGFDLFRLLPGATKLQESASARTGLLHTLLLGAVGGVAGFCAGPILGAILTLAFGQTNLWNAGALLAVYGLGMVVPLVVIAALWQKLSARSRRALRGRTFSALGREFHSTSVITGVLIVAVGALFWFTNGLVSLPSLIPTDVLVWFQERGSVLSNPIIDVVAIIAAAAIALTVWGVSRRRNGSTQPQESVDEQ